MSEIKKQILRVFPTIAANIIDKAVPDTCWDEVEEIRIFKSGCL